MADAFVTGLADRVKNILLTPKTEWEKIESEKTTIPDLYKGYACILAILPPIGAFVKFAVFGTTVPVLNTTVRTPMGHALGGLIGSYVIGLLGVAALAFIIDFLAPKFGGVSNQINAFKLGVYSMTAAWIAGLGLVVPVIGPLIVLAGFYSLYLFYLGVQKLLKVPQSQAAICTIAALVINVIVMMVANAIVH